MLSLFFICIISFVFYITIKHLSVTYMFLSSWVTPLFILFLVLLVLLITLIVITIIKKVKE